MFEQKKVLVLGFARSGYEACKVLLEHGCTVVLNDAKDEEKHSLEKIEELKKQGVQFVFGSHPEDLLDESFDYLIKNPGISPNHMYIEKAKTLGIPVINEVELAYHFLKELVTIVGITGTNGKTTTTTLTYEILKEAFPQKVHLAGNIGYPLCSFIKKVKKGDIIVMEVSCQQGANFEEFHPHIGLVTNFSEAHIDFFGSYAAYKQAKAKMFYKQSEEDIAILNLENEEVLKELQGITSKVKYFSSQHEISGGYYKEDALYYYGEKVLDTKKIQLKGVHNLENVLSAIMIAKEFGVANEVIEKVVKNFKGVAHRLEFVGEVKGRKFYNDTEATNIKCTQIALSSFDEPIILFLGGLERGQDFEALLPMMKSVKQIIGIGSCRDRVLEFGQKHKIPTVITEHLKEGFQEGYQLSKEGDILLLSPASASWDQYEKCEDRGDEWKKYVKELEEKEKENDKD